MLTRVGSVHGWVFGDARIQYQDSLASVNPSGMGQGLLHIGRRVFLHPRAELERSQLADGRGKVGGRCRVSAGA